MVSPIKLFEHSLESKQSSVDEYSSDEQFEMWFLASHMRNKKKERKYERITLLPNRKAHEETKFDKRYKANNRIAVFLSEFFPKRWLSEITAIFSRIDSQKLGIKSEEDRLCSYLGYIELYLVFRGLTLLDSTLQEINTRLSTHLIKSNVRTWKMRLLEITPDLRDHWKKIRASGHQIAITAAVIDMMNKELILTNCTEKEIFTIKHRALDIACKFAHYSKGRNVKNIEVWAWAICLKAVRDCIPKYFFLFSQISQLMNKK